MQLVLNGGLTGSEGSFHDWNYLLDATGMLARTTQVAGFIRILGTLAIILAIVGCIRFSLKEGSSESRF
jgi:hypothetical protein